MNPDASIQGKLIDNTSMSFPNKFIINEKYKADFIGQKDIRDQLIFGSKLKREI